MRRQIKNFALSLLLVLLGFLVYKLSTRGERRTKESSFGELAIQF